MFFKAELLCKWPRVLLSFLCLVLSVKCEIRFCGENGGSQMLLQEGPKHANTNM